MIKRMNKKGVVIKSALQAVLAFSAVIISISVIISFWGIQYNSNITDDLSEFNQLDDVSEELDVYTQRLSPDDPDPGTDAEANTFRGVYGILSTILNTFANVIGSDGLINGISERFGVPSYVPLVIISMIVVALVFSIIGIIFRVGRAV